jgi:hypothetical protein
MIFNYFITTNIKYNIYNIYILIVKSSIENENFQQIIRPQSNTQSQSHSLCNSQSQSNSQKGYKPIELNMDYNDYNFIQNNNNNNHNNKIRKNSEVSKFSNSENEENYMKKIKQKKIVIKDNIIIEEIIGKKK